MGRFPPRLCDTTRNIQLERGLLLAVSNGKFFRRQIFARWKKNEVVYNVYATRIYELHTAEVLISPMQFHVLLPKLSSR